MGVFMSYCRICGRAIKEHKTVGDVCGKEIDKILKKEIDNKQARLEKSQEYIYARKSSVPNLGVDIPGSARVSYHAYKNVSDIEALGPEVAKKMILKKNLLINMPIDTENSGIEDVVRVSLARKAFESFPNSPQYPKAMDRIEENVVVFALVRGYKTMNSIIEMSTNRELLEQMKLRYKNPQFMFVVEFESLEATRQKIRSDYFDRFKFLQEHLNNRENFPSSGNPAADVKLYGEQLFGKYFDQFGMIMSKTRGRTLYSIHADDSGMFNKLRRYNDPRFLKNTLTEEGLNDVLLKLSGKKPKRDPSETPKSNKVKIAAFNPIVFYPNQVLERIGPNPSEKNIDELIDSLENKWGFKGVQNGNTVKDSEREEHYSQANMALQDLMDVLKIKDPKKMTFGGKLSLAIGSLKGTRNALAFYRPSVDAIALSRKKGIGALGHEWGHALENHFLKNNKTQSTFRINDGFRNKVNSFVEKMRRSEDYKKCPSSHQSYLRKDAEVFARVFESMVNHKLEKMGRKNTYLVSHAENFAYPTKAELNEMESDFDSVIATLIERS